MRKLLDGIIEFRKTVRPGFRETFAKLALGQSPDALFIACSDSRVAPNVFASTDPGDLFVVRNVGNMIPACGSDGMSAGDESEAAAIEFALRNLSVKDIVVCGHSECGAMQALVNGLKGLDLPHLKLWLGTGLPALEKLARGELLDSHLAPHNCLSQLNVIEQMANLMTYPIVKEKVLKGKLRIHGWWFDIANAEVQVYAPQLKRFVVLDESYVAAYETP